MRLFLTIILGICGVADGAERRTENVILVTLDGVRTEEIFEGLQGEIATHSAEQVYSEIEYGRDVHPTAGVLVLVDVLLPWWSAW